VNKLYCSYSEFQNISDVLNCLFPHVEENVILVLGVIRVVYFKITPNGTHLKKNRPTILGAIVD